MANIKNNLYLLTLKLFGTIYRCESTSGGFIPFTVVPWTPVTVGTVTKYCSYDYIPLPTRIFAYLLNKLAPTVDNSELKPYSDWSVLQQLSIGDYIPEESQQDLSLDDFLLNKTGSFYLKKVIDVNNTINNNKGQWIVDFSYMEVYPVKDGYYRYGGKVVFDDNRTKIYYVDYLGQRYYDVPQWLQIVVKATVTVVSVIEVHLCRLHIVTAQGNTLKWRNSVLPTDNIIPLLQVVTFNTLNVNRNIEGLLGIFQNTYALTSAGMNSFVMDSIAKGGLDNEAIYGYSVQHGMTR